MEIDFRAVLAGHTALTDMVGSRIYPVQYPQGVANPALRYRVISATTGLHMQGSDGLSETLMQVDVRAGGFDQAVAVRDELVALLHPFRGVQGDTEFRLIRLETDRGVDFERPDSVEIWTASIDFRVWSRVAA